MYKMFISLFMLLYVFVTSVYAEDSVKNIYDADGWNGKYIYSGDAAIKHTMILSKSSPSRNSLFYVMFRMIRENQDSEWIMVINFIVHVKNKIFLNERIDGKYIIDNKEGGDCYFVVFNKNRMLLMLDKERWEFDFIDKLRKSKGISVIIGGGEDSNIEYFNLNGFGKAFKSLQKFIKETFYKSE